MGSLGEQAMVECPFLKAAYKIICQHLGTFGMTECFTDCDLLSLTSCLNTIMPMVNIL